MHGYFLTMRGNCVECSSLAIFEKHPALQEGEGAFLQTRLWIDDHSMDFLSWGFGSSVSWTPGQSLKDASPCVSNTGVNDQRLLGASSAQLGFGMWKGWGDWLIP